MIPPTTASTHSASLYVGDLPGSISEGNLFEVFKSAGPLASIRVCRDTVTRRSLGYAYVNYINTADAEKALENLNGHIFSGKPCRVMWVQRDPSIRKSGVGNIFIKNLEKSITHKDLYDTFSEFGNILSAKVSLNEHGESKGFGFVHFEKQEDAEAAIKRVNNMELKGKVIYVGPFIPRTSRASSSSKASFTNLYLKDFPVEWSEEKVKELFAPFGEIQNVSLPSATDGKKRGFGFVNYKSHDAALKAIEALNGKEFDGKKLYVARFQKKTERQLELRRRRDEAMQGKIEKWRGTNLFIKNIDDTVTEEILKTEFGKFGAISSGVIMKDDKGNSKGFGFICYENPEQAENAINEMHGKMLAGKPLYVALAQRKEERRAQLEQHHQRKRVIPGPFAGPPVFYPPGTPGFFPQQFARGVPRGPFPYAYPYGGSGPGMGGPGMGGPSGAPRAGGQRPPRGGPGAAPAPRAAPAPVPVPAPLPIPGPEASELTAAQLAGLDPRAQTQLLGERLFPKIMRLQPERCGKITGMLLERYKNELPELLKLLSSDDELANKVKEAVSVLESHERAHTETAAT